MRTSFYNKYYSFWKTKYATPLKKKRVNFINNIMGGQLFDQSWYSGKEILEIGCANGKDFIQFFNNCHSLHITGIDIEEYVYTQENVTFLKVDAENLPFADNHFDLCVSFGTLEHIQPIEKLCRVVSEIDRVSKSYAILVPSISTFFEPHTREFFWQLKTIGKKRLYSHLNYFSDEAWLQLQGFRKARVKRYSYIPFFIKNTVIFKK